MNHSIKEILSLLEDVFVACLKPHLTAPISEEINYQLEDILIRQFAENNYGELGGSINLIEKGGLELRLVKSKVLEEKEIALQEYIKGNYDNIDILKSSTEKAIEIHDSYLTKECFAMHCFKSTLEHFNNPPDDIEFRKLVIEFYQIHVLGTTYIVFPSELGVGKNGFLGLFHVHDDGSNPLISI